MDKNQEITKEVVADPNERQWAMFTHLSALATFIIPIAGNIIGPLVIYLIKKDEYSFVERVGKQVLNFQITWSIIFIISSILIVIGIGILMLIVFGIAWLVLVVLASIEASNGKAYRYPLSIDFIK